MTKAQLIIVTMGLALIFGRFLSSPYRFEGRDPLHRARTGEERIVLGRVHAPFWAPPDSQSTVEKARIRLRDPELVLEDASVELDALRLTLWAGGIALMTLLAVGAPGSRAGAARKPRR